MSYLNLIFVATERPIFFSFTRKNIITLRDYVLDKVNNPSILFTTKEDSLLPLKPYQILSLWDMVRIYLEEISTLIRLLTKLELELKDYEHRPNIKLPPERYDYFAGVLVETYRIVDDLGLNSSRDLIIEINKNIPQPLNGISLGSFYANIKTLHGYFKKELSKQYTVAIPQDKIPYLETKSFISEQVLDAFPSAHYDIMEAGICYAFDRSTACVFHLMRVAEIGLRALASDRRIKFKKKAPLELREWDDILKGLEDAEKAIQGYPKTKARESQYAFYHGAMVELRAFKNLYRNRTMHGREIYDSDQAHSALVHVSKFMDVLAATISENKRTPMIWKKALF